MSSTGLLNQSWTPTKSMEKSLDTCNSRILLTALNMKTTYYKHQWTIWRVMKLKIKESERLVIQRMQHSKLSFSSQQEKPSTVEKLKTLHLLLTTWWRTLIRNQFQKSKLQQRTRQRKGRHQHFPRIYLWIVDKYSSTSFWQRLPTEF